MSGRSQTCKLQNVPRLSYNVSVATENGKTVRLPTVRFCSTKGELYYLNCFHAAETKVERSKRLRSKSRTKTYTLVETYRS